MESRGHCIDGTLELLTVCCIAMAVFATPQHAPHTEKWDKRDGTLLVGQLYRPALR